MQTTDISALQARLAYLEEVWTAKPAPRRELVEPELTAVATEVATLIALRGRPGWERDLDALTHAVGRLWHRLPKGDDRSETHWHGHLEAITQMLGIAIDAQAEDGEIASALGTPANAKVLRALAEAPEGLTNRQLAERLHLVEETVSRSLKALRGLGFVISMKLGRHVHSSLTGTGQSAAQTLPARAEDQQIAVAASAPQPTEDRFGQTAPAVTAKVLLFVKPVPRAA